MKNKILIFSLAIILIISVICIYCIYNKESVSSFRGKVVEVGTTSVIVEPFVGESIRKSSDKVAVSIIDNKVKYKVGDIVKVTYTGEVMESYPVQINEISIEIEQ